MRRMCLILLAISCLMISACVTLGPKTETHYVIVKPGVPVRILDNVTVRCRTLAAEMVDDNNVGGGIVKQDVGGWVAMPMAHWEQIVESLKEAKTVERKDSL